MRIAQVAPLYESVPPQLYGGTERVVSYLTEELVRLGHEVTLFASGDSITQARLHASCHRALRLDPSCRDPLAPHIRMLGQVYQRAHEFDIIHCHTDYLSLPLARYTLTPTVITLHGRLDIPELAPLYGEYPDVPLVSISGAQRFPLPQVNWAATVYHGLPLDLYPSFQPYPGAYLLFLGRIAPEKRPDCAIRVACRAEVPLRIAAKVDKADREYFETTIRPLLDHPLIDFIGEVNDPKKRELLSNALALVFPIDWPEPFGLVMIEALALDSQKRPCWVVSSNAGHCLFGGIAEPDKAGRVIARLMHDDMFCGWGIRTLSSQARRYNPMSYHNGSVWPHDNALIAAGFARYGASDRAAQLLTALFDASLTIGDRRLPELFCGFPRYLHQCPVPYPVACKPQAWAAGSVFLLLQATLGLSVNAWQRSVIFDRTALPPWLNRLDIRGLHVGDGRVDLSVIRGRWGAAVEVIDKQGEIEIVVRK